MVGKKYHMEELKRKTAIDPVYEQELAHKYSIAQDKQNEYARLRHSKYLIEYKERLLAGNPTTITALKYKDKKRKEYNIEKKLKSREYRKKLRLKMLSLNIT